MIRVGITGCLGRMGRYLSEEISKTPGCVLAGGTVRASHPQVGQTVDGYLLESSPERLFEKSDVIIDFTTPGSTERHLELARLKKIPLVIGTTGFSDETDQAITQASREIPLVQSPNMSLGINLLMSLVEKTASLLDENFDIEIMETHHRHKKDAPSGTSIKLGKMAASGRKTTLSLPISLDRNHLRQQGEIGFSVSRGGGIPGDHAVSFASEGEVLTLSHRSLTPVIYAQGAIKAAQWLLYQPPGRYGMKEVLGI